MNRPQLLFRIQAALWLLAFLVPEIVGVWDREASVGTGALIAMAVLGFDARQAGKRESAQSLFRGLWIPVTAMPLIEMYGLAFSIPKLLGLGVGLAIDARRTRAALDRMRPTG